MTDSSDYTRIIAYLMVLGIFTVSIATFKRGTKAP